MGNIKLISSKGKKREKPVKRRTAAKTAFVIILILVIAFATLTISLGIYVQSLDVVWPNVWADGVKLSGMTLEEARLMLVSEGYESNAEGVAATVTFPDGSAFTITGDEAGFSFNAEDAAVAAYEYGRGVSFFADEIAFIRAYLTRTELRDLSLAMFSNKEYVREVAAEYTKAYNNALVDAANDIDITDERITVIKGVQVFRADEDSVFDLAVDTMLRAMEERAHLTANYTTEEAVIGEIDLMMLFDRIFIEPVSAQYDAETFSATESSSGVTFDMEAAQAMLDRAGTGTQVVIPLLVVEPEVTKEDIESMLFRDVLAETTTYANGTSNRVMNITLAAAEIDGTQLNPGDVFSFNGIVGERTAARGFREANAYVSGLTVLEIGGGICQVSSTIYNSVLHADLEVVERRPHGYAVSYLPLGNDATVAWGYIDFKFRNNTDYPLRIESTMDGRDLTVKLIGTKLDDSYIKIETVRISTTPYQTVEREDETIDPGTTSIFTDGYTGFTVDTYKHFFDGEDNLVMELYVGRSTYNVRDKVILIPIPQEDPEETDPETDPEGDPTDDPADGPAGEPTEEPTDGTTGEPTDEPGGEPADEPGGEPTDGPPEEPGDEPSGESEEDPGDDPSIEPEDGLTEPDRQAPDV